jgi:cell pole-organizing protein PopZ
MADLNAEPSMEDILSSIKRIISEEDTPAARPRRPVRVPTLSAVPSPAETNDDDEVLELSDPMPKTPDFGRSPETAAAKPEPIVSENTATAARGAIDALSRLMVKPEAPSDGTLEGLVREMLRPMLREWLDANLPDMVERIVAREIAKIAGTGQ